MAAALPANSSMACSCTGDICASPAGVQPLFGQVGQQGGLERVASAYAVAHRHWLRSDSELAVLPAEQLRAIATPRDHHQLGAVAQPALGNAMWFDALVKQAQILVTDLDQMGLLGEGLDPLAPAGKIRLDVEPHVRVEGNQALCLFTAQQFQQRLGDGRGHQRVGTEVDAADPVGQRPQLLRLQQTVGAAVTAKAVDRRAIVAQRNHRQRGRCIEDHQLPGIDAFLLQQTEQALAKVIVGQSAEQRRLDVQSRQADRDVIRRTAGHRFQIQAIAAGARPVNTSKSASPQMRYMEDSCCWKSAELKRGAGTETVRRWPAADTILHC